MDNNGNKYVSLAEYGGWFNQHTGQLERRRPAASRLPVKVLYLRMLVLS